MEKKIGYTQGTFDMFHIGHLNLIRNAKKHCDYLIVGVNADDLVESYKNKRPIVLPYTCRMSYLEQYFGAKITYDYENLKIYIEM